MAAIAVGAVAVLTPLKTVQPYVIRVDNATGVVDVVPALRGAVSESEAVTRYLVTQYVTARERYVPALAESDYEQVGAYHSPLMNQAWAALWNRSNPESPLNVHADGSTVRVQVTAVSFLAPGSGRRDLAQVRFVRTRGEGGAGPRAGHYVATLQYAFGEPSKDDRLRSVESARVQGARVPPRARGGGRRHGARSVRAPGAGVLACSRRPWRRPAAVVPPPGAGDPRVREIDYDPAEVVSLTGYLGYHIHLELAPEETFVALGAGDSAAVDIAAEGPHVMLKPKAAQGRDQPDPDFVATGVSLRVSDVRGATAGRTGDLRAPVSIRAGGRRSEPRRDEPCLGRCAGGGAGGGPGRGAAAGEPRLLVLRLARLRPVAVSDDGVQTRLTFDARGEWPAIFVANADGSESLVNFHAEGTTAVVHRVAREFVLRRGRWWGASRIAVTRAAVSSCRAMRRRAVSSVRCGRECGRGRRRGGRGRMDVRGAPSTALPSSGGFGGESVHGVGGAARTAAGIPGERGVALVKRGRCRCRRRCRTRLRSGCCCCWAWLSDLVLLGLAAEPPPGAARRKPAVQGEMLLPPLAPGPPKARRRGDRRWGREVPWNGTAAGGPLRRRWRRPCRDGVGQCGAATGSGGAAADHGAGAGAWQWCLCGCRGV